MRSEGREGRGGREGGWRRDATQARNALRGAHSWRLILNFEEAEGSARRAREVNLKGCLTHMPDGSQATSADAFQT